MRIAVLDNDASQVDLITQVLTAAGHDCHVYPGGKELLAALRRDGCAMLILDWQVADLQAAEVLRRAKETVPSTFPVLFFASTSGTTDILAGLGAGADDYMLKPLRRGELALRTEALLRRAYPSQNEAEKFEFGLYVFETRPGRLLRDGIPIDLTHKEFELALLFFRNLGRPLSRAFIHDAVWIGDPALASRTMDTHVSRVRNKLALRPENGLRLAPVYSYGYRLEKLAH